MRYLTLFVSAVFILSACVISAQDKVDFSGEWIFNADESDMGGPPGGGRGGMMGASGMTITQEENRLMVETTRRGFEGNEMTIISTYTLDGEKCENGTNFGTTTSYANWSEDGKTLSIQSSMTMSKGDQEFTMDTTDNYSLNEDMLVVETIRAITMGDMISIAVYDKAEE